MRVLHLKCCELDAVEYKERIVDLCVPKVNPGKESFEQRRRMLSQMMTDIYGRTTGSTYVRRKIPRQRKKYYENKD